jgi:hypothetical protein
MKNDVLTTFVPHNLLITVNCVIHALYCNPFQRKVENKLSISLYEL